MNCLFCLPTSQFPISTNMVNPRVSGILLHPTSLPSKFGIGDLGQEAYIFIDFLAANYQQIWQILPLGPTGYGHSPYLCYSAFAGNALLISLENLCTKGLLTEEDLGNLPEFPADRVDYDLVIATKLPLLEKASQNFYTQASPGDWEEFHQFCASQADWLDDYALFMAIKAAHGDVEWTSWEADIAKREPEAIKNWQQSLEKEIFLHKYIQFLFFSQWGKLRHYAHEKGVRIFGDLPIYVAPDSADVWAHPELFCLDEATGKPALMAGVPPDYFSATGQLWGNPVYNWTELAKTNFAWWVRRVEVTLEYVDLVRIDHFRGFQAFWAVEAPADNAMEGRWIEAPGADFFRVLQDKLGHLPIVAEDLGIITPEVEALRDQFQLPGMKVTHFAFDSDRANPFLPYNYPSTNCVAYTGTHDNDTTIGWFAGRSPQEKQRVMDYLGCIDAQGINWSLIRLVFSSIANQAVIPMQDILGLDTQGRMNFPGQAEGNWNWRYRKDLLTVSMGNYLKELTYIYGRTPFN